MIQEYSIGRGDDCKIRLHDPSSRTSRNHATLKIMKNGKMFISDYSSNGTWVNGVKVMQNVDYPLRRGDTVSFAQVVELNWEQIPRSSKAALNVIIGCVVLILMAGAYVLMANGNNWYPFAEEEKPEPVVSFTMDKEKATIGDTIAFTNTSANVSSYSWNFGDGNVSTDKNPKHVYTGQGTFKVTVIAKGEDGEKSASKTIVISPKKRKPEPVIVKEPVADFSMDKVEVVVGDSISFTNTSKYTSHYTWNFGDGNTSTEKNPKHSYSKKGTFTVTLSAKGEGGKNSISKTIQVSPKIPPKDTLNNVFF